jgi:hypothetical protein
LQWLGQSFETSFEGFYEYTAKITTVDHDAVEMLVRETFRVDLDLVYIPVRKDFLKPGLKVKENYPLNAKLFYPLFQKKFLPSLF